MAIGGFEIAVIVVGVVELAKQIGLKDKGALGLALGLGLLLFGYGSAVEAGLIAEAVVTWATVVIRAIGYTLAVPGLYDLLIKRVARA